MTKVTPYEIMYGHQPPFVTSYIPCASKVQDLDKFMQGREATLQALKDNLHMAQNRMKQQVDQQCFERFFQEGDHVFLSLQPYKQNFLKT